MSPVPRGPTKIKRQSISGGLDEEKYTRKSWELSDAASILTSTSLASKEVLSVYTSWGGSQNQNFDSASADYHDYDSIGYSSDEDIFMRDKYDMMVRHLWNVGEREGWFRDPKYDGLVSIR